MFDLSRSVNYVVEFLLLVILIILVILVTLVIPVLLVWVFQHWCISPSQHRDAQHRLKFERVADMDPGATVLSYLKRWFCDNVNRLVLPVLVHAEKSNRHHPTWHLATEDCILGLKSEEDVVHTFNDQMSDMIEWCSLS